MASNSERPTEFSLPIQGGMLDNLGINMYANLGKCLVELAANAYDGDATYVDIAMDIQGIAAARVDLRQAAIAVSKKNGEKRPTFIEDPLPSGLTVVVTDDGHGMDPAAVQEKFLPLNRNRRKDPSGQESQPKSEAGKRFVMGRKGIGKLSAFGAASTLSVWTKRAGDTFATKITLRLSELRDVKDLSDVKIAAQYEEGVEKERHGTVLTLSDLKCDSMKFDEADLHDVLAETFYPISDAEFSLRINGKPINRLDPPTEFYWPNPKGVPVKDRVVVEDGAELDFDYIARFRDASLKASRRGARIYCNGRLAYGPSLISLNTGTHNFMAHQYLEFVVNADDLDRQNVDLISTDRGDIRRNNDLVEAFLSKLTLLMQQAIADHGKFRELKASDDFKNAPEAKAVRDIVEAMPRKQRSAGKRIVNVIVSRYGVKSDEFATIAPLLISTMNAGEVLVDLIRVSSNPKDIKELAGYIVELGEIEKSDALKIYRGRRDGISGLRNLANRGEDEWMKGPRSEAELHQLLKAAPWLIRPELSGYLASDRNLAKVVSVLAKALELDDFSIAGKTDETDLDSRKIDRRRPDLVFLLGNAPQADRVLVVELKSPNLPLEMEHLSQLKSYIRRVEEWFETEHKGQRRPFVVEGILIGAMPDTNTRAEGPRDLLSEIKKRGAGEQWEVVGLRELLARTEAVHRELIDALQRDMADGEQDDEEGATPLLTSPTAPADAE